MQVLQTIGSHLFSAACVLAWPLLGILLANVPAQSAENIVIKYRAAQRSISVNDLDTFVTTGNIPRSLRWYAARLTEEQQLSLRTVLQQPLPIAPKAISSFVKSPFGRSVLQRLLVLFWGGLEPDAMLKALRASLLLAASDGEGLTVMNAIRHYPLNDLRIDMNVVQRTMNDLKEIAIDSETIFAAIERQAAPELRPTSFESLPPNVLEPRAVGNLEWDKLEIEFSNPKRDEDELVSADVYLPRGLDSPAPPIVISHGFANSRTTFTYLAEHWVSHGFAVAVLQHPGSDSLRLQQFARGEADLPDSKLFLQRPHDISALLDHLEQKTASDPRWQSRLQTDTVGVFGHSLGGYTALASGGATLDFDHLDRRCQDEPADVLPTNLSLLFQCQALKIPIPQRDMSLRDDRVVAVLTVSPIGSALFGPEGMGQLEVPVVMVAASDDIVAPAVEEQIVPFTWLDNDDEQYLLVVKNATHLSFHNSRDEVFFNIPTGLIGPDPRESHSTMKWLSTTFFEAYMNDSEERESFLTEFSLPPSSGELQFALTRTFTQADLDAALTLTQ